MADWNTPLVTTAHATYLDNLKARDFDAASLFLNEPSNHIQGMIKLVRSPVKFQERGASAWGDLLLSVTGGGTGAATAVDARTNLGLGTMATQNSNSVAITGGSLAGNGAGVTDLNASNLASGTVPVARLGLGAAANKYLRGDSTFQTPLWSEISKAGSSLADLATRSAGDLSSGTVATARLGSGTADTTTFLRGDSTWAEVGVVKSVQKLNVNYAANPSPNNFIDFTIASALTNHLNAVFIIAQMRATFSDGTTFPVSVGIISNTAIRMALSQVPTNNIAIQASFQIIEFKNVG